MSSDESGDSDGQPGSRRSSRQKVPKQFKIPDLVSSVLNGHIEECVQYARVATRRNFASSDLCDQVDDAAHQKCIRNRKWYISEQVRQRMRENNQRDLTHIDPSTLALHAIPHIPILADRSKSRITPRTRTRYGGILIPRPCAVPRYDAWIPVVVNYYVGKELNVEPYMPFLGDHDNECEAAFEVYEDMAGDAGKDLDLSDGELNEAGKLILPRGERERINFYAMADTRWREGARRAILVILDRVDVHNDKMWHALSKALGIDNIPRVKAVASVARQRRVEDEERKRRRQYLLNACQELDTFHDLPVDDVTPSDGDYSLSSNPLKYFCFTCHMFVCLHHAGVDVRPMLPIEDLHTLKREKAIKDKKWMTCSTSCGLLHLAPISVDDDWTAPEILLLRDAITVFGMDPCSIAVVVGTRSCSEVATKLNDPMEADIAQEEILKARAPRQPTVKNKAGTDDDKKDESKKPNKTVVELMDMVSTDQDFVPCEHSGPCTIDVCTCVKKGIYCESTCGCKFGRYAEGGATGGIVWQPPSKDAVSSGSARDCLNRHYGCSCEAGHCTEGDCPCWDQYRGCSPEWCECDVTLLPGRTPLEKRRCRNGPITVGHHKRTFIGKSEVHGFGLFAAQRFEVGDLVGVYSGQLMDTRLADMIGRIYDATNRTYIFNVTESLVIDGGLLGSKAKFCNHTKAGVRENCHSRLVRVRGDAYVALFCKRPVEPGAEFLFDYRFTGEVPDWAKDDRNKSKK